MRTPDFWTRRSISALLLWPLSLLYRLGAAWDRRRKTPQRLPVPIISIGNVTAGGAGKTPTTLAITQLLQQQGHALHILSRGYGANIRGALRVSPNHHRATDVGDEALLLAQHAPTWVGAQRAASGYLAIAAGATLLVCDDALQHHALAKDINLLVVDGAYGLGNGFLLPAGPLREPWSQALARCDAVILIGEDKHGLYRTITQPIFKATLAPTGDITWLKGAKVHAFAGIARPQKFYDTLRDLGTTLLSTENFADHHEFTESQLQALAKKGTLVTTQKDWVRLSPEWQQRIRYVPVALTFENADGFMTWLEQRLDA